MNTRAKVALKTNFMGITRALALSGMTDFAFVEEDDLWRGSEVHKIISLAAKGTLIRESVPEELRGYLAARDKFVKEVGYVTTRTEETVQSKDLNLRGRIDDAGLLHGKPALVEWKTGSIPVAVKYQLCLGGYLHNPEQWFHRYAVKLKPDGNYSMKCFPLMTWPHDLSTALACVRVAQAKIADGLAERMEP